MEKIIRNIYINGNILEDNTVIDMTEENILEVETKSYVDWILESLSSCKYFIENFFEIVEYLKFKSENGQRIFKEDIDEFHSFLTWLIDLLYLIEEAYSFTETKEFFEIIDTLENKIEVLAEKRKKKAYIDYVNILEIEISNILDKLYSNLNVYSRMILEEEKKKKLVI